MNVKRFRIIKWKKDRPVLAAKSISKSFDGKMVLRKVDLDLQKGDEILIPTFTFISVAEVVVLLGLRPVFIDVDQNNFMFDLDSIESKITKKTKVIIPVHLFGQSEDMERVMAISKKYNLYVISSPCSPF